MVDTSTIERRAVVALARKKYINLSDKRRAFDEIGNNITVRVTQRAARGFKNSVNCSNLVQIVLPDTEEKTTKLLPADVKDIDANNRENVFLVPEYVSDIYVYLRTLEDKYPVPKGYLEGRAICPRMRGTVVDWMVDVQVQYRLLQETLHLSVCLLDEFLAKTPQLETSQLQLASVSAMLLASKFEETYAPGLKQFLFVCDHAYSAEQLLSMEQRFLRALDFALARPLVILFLRRYAMAADSDPLQHAYSKYFVDLTLVSYSFCHEKPSRVAAAAVFIAKCVAKGRVNSLFWTPTLCFYSGYTLYDFAPLVPSLVRLIKDAKHGKLTAVRRKYSAKHLLEVSLMPSLSPSSPLIKSLSNFQHFNRT